MALMRMMMVAALGSAALAACSGSEENMDVLPENIAEQNLPAVETVQENDQDLDVNTVDIGDDAIAVPTAEQ